MPDHSKLWVACTVHRTPPRLRVGVIGPCPETLWDGQAHSSFETNVGEDEAALEGHECRGEGSAANPPVPGTVHMARKRGCAD